MGRRGLALIVALLLAIPAFAGQPPTETQSDRGSPSRALRPVTAERLVNADAEPDNWLMYSGDYKSRRYTGLDQIDTTNVAGLQVRWVHQMAELGRAGTTPLVVDGVMYITEPPSSVIALDAGTGRPYWRYDHPLPDELNYCCGQANRGVAIPGRPAVHEHAGCARRRPRRQDRQRPLGTPRPGTRSRGYSKKAAPLVVGDRIITGIAGGEFGIRGFLDAYDAQTGDLDWRFDTVPGPDHPDSRSWQGD